MAGAPRKVFWKIDYYSDASRAFGAEDTFDITHCYRVLSKQISVYPLDSGGPFVCHGIRNRAQLRLFWWLFQPTVLPNSAGNVRTKGQLKALLLDQPCIDAAGSLKYN